MRRLVDRYAMVIDEVEVSSDRLTHDRSSRVVDETQKS